MNDKLTELLAQLAQKLGTTAEHLWGVLIVQARVAFWTTLVEILALIVLTAICYRVFRNTTKRMANPDDEWYNDGWMDHPGLTFPLAIGSAALTLLWIALIVDASSILASAINPEYWALEKVFGMLGKGV